MAYVDWTYYSTTYLGNAIAQAELPYLALRASANIDLLTFGRAAGVVLLATDAETIDKIKMATCAVADELKKLETTGGAVTSERVGNYAVTYASQQSEGKRCAQAAKLYLGLTGLMSWVPDEN